MFTHQCRQGVWVQLLQDDPILLPEDLKDNLQQTVSRLSDWEKQVLSLLARQNNGINLAKLLENTKIPSSDLVNVVQSLLRRCLIEPQESFYTLPSVLKQYMITTMYRYFFLI